MANDQTLVTVTFVYSGDDYGCVADTIMSQIFERPDVSKGTINTKLLLGDSGSKD
jgi:hypothetical protein